jgi:hypothetical protein
MMRYLTRGKPVDFNHPGGNNGKRIVRRNANFNLIKAQLTAEWEVEPSIYS